MGACAYRSRVRADVEPLCAALEALGDWVAIVDDGRIIRRGAGAPGPDDLVELARLAGDERRVVRASPAAPAFEVRAIALDGVLARSAAPSAEGARLIVGRDVD